MKLGVNKKITGKSNDFANRLYKNAKRVETWAKQHGVWCYRVYDRDLPEYNVTIDVYERWLLIQEYAPPKSVDFEKAQQRFLSVLDSLRNFFGVSRENIYIKQRRRQRGRDQYQRKSATVDRYNQVREGNCYFLVNFSNYLDTGLFLDHRPIRERIARSVFRKRFLNLFGYTGSATVRAAKGGALKTTTVDLSANYLQWARMNLALNGLSLDSNELIREDCMS